MNTPSIAEYVTMIRAMAFVFFAVAAFITWSDLRRPR